MRVNNRITWVPKMANKSGPDLVCVTSAANKGPATLRRIKMAEMAVAKDREIHSTTWEGIKHTIVAGINGTKL